MAGTSTPIYPQTLKNWYAQLLPATGIYTLPTSVSTSTSNLVALAVGDTNGDKIEMISAASTDTVAQVLNLVIVTAINTFLVGVVNIPALSGWGANAPTVNVLGSTQFPAFPFDANGNPYLYLPSGSTLYVGTWAAVSTGKLISVVAQGGAF